MRRTHALVLALGALVIGVGALAGADRRAPIFPHEKHERLFPVCEGCHVGIPSGDTAHVFPERAVCEQCHDGAVEKRVPWEPPVSQPRNLQFTHGAHLERTTEAGEVVACQTCHAAPDAPGRMSVGPAEPERCLQCHAHRAETHLAATVECTQCHVPLTAATELPVGRIAAFPTPLSHNADDFVSTHGADARAPRVTCSVCHARESCERCHANAERLDAIVVLARDARVATIERAKAAAYPRPATHSGAWTQTHGVAAQAEAASCANCHTQPSCTACHRTGDGGARAVIAGLPPAAPQKAQGVSAATIARAIHPVDFGTSHGTAAASGGLGCAQCHAQRECAQCHAGSDSRAFHAANFVERHAMDVFAGGGACQSCHTTETFCRACHERTGVSAAAGMSAAFHDAQPMWVLAHGQAARTSMETCASCHRQSDCVRCHSAARGWGVNPHGRDFAAGRLGERSAATCRFCHVGDPGGGD